MALTKIDGLYFANLLCMVFQVGGDTWVMVLSVRTSLKMSLHSDIPLGVGPTPYYCPWGGYRHGLSLNAHPASEYR